MAVLNFDDDFERLAQAVEADVAQRSGFSARSRGVVRTGEDRWIGLARLESRDSTPTERLFTYEGRIWVRELVDFFGDEPFPPRRTWAQNAARGSWDGRWSELCGVKEWWRFSRGQCDPGEFTSRLESALLRAVGEIARRANDEWLIAEWWQPRGGEFAPPVDDWAKAALLAKLSGRRGLFDEIVEAIRDVPQTNPSRRRANWILKQIDRNIN